jgi:murein DD-endopeptidase MepM/ murein hydrolase activator NlpD
MIKALENIDGNELNNLAKKTSVIRMSNQNKQDSQQYTLTKKTTATMSNNFTTLYNSFNKILSNTKNVKELQKVQTKSNQNKNTTIIAAPVQIIGVEKLTGNIKILGKYFENLAKLMKKLDLNPDENDQDEDSGDDTTIIDADEKKKKKTTGKKKGRGKTKLKGRGRGLGGKALGIFAAGMDMFDRLGDGESITEAGVGVAGGVAGGFAGAEAGAALGALGGVAAPITVPLGGLIGGAIGYFAGGKIADTAYDAATKVSPADKRLESAAAKASVVPARREPSEISNNSYSSRFADYLSDTFDNVKSYVSGIIGYVLGPDIGGGGDGGQQGPLSGNTNENFQKIMDIASRYGDPHPELTAAQWAHESGSGTSRLARELNNPFGQTTNNPNDGETVVGKDGVTRIFKRYNSIEDSIKHHVERWNKKYTDSKQTPRQALSQILNNRYTTEAEKPGYYAAIGQHLASNNISYDSPYTPTGPLTGGQLMNPVPSGVFKSGFGDPREGGRKHKGIDLAAPIGTPIMASAAGKVVLVGWSGAYGGNRVRIDHGNGLWTSYEHMSRFAVREGQDVVAGQIIGAVGNTGIGTGPHVHFTVWRDGKETDPIPYISAPNPAPRPEMKISAKWQKAAETLYGPKKTKKPSLLIVPSSPQQQQQIPYQFNFGVQRPKQQNSNSKSQYLNYHNQ